VKKETQCRQKYFSAYGIKMFLSFGNKSENSPKGKFKKRDRAYKMNELSLPSRAPGNVL